MSDLRPRCDWASIPRRMPRDWSRFWPRPSRPCRRPWAQDCSHALVGEFARQHPSRFRSARAYGEELPRWLARASPGRGRRALPIWRGLNGRWRGAFDAADQLALTAREPRGHCPGAMAAAALHLSPTLRRLSVTSNCVAWWKFACAAQPAAEPLAIDLHPAMAGMAPGAGRVLPTLVPRGIPGTRCGSRRGPVRSTV